MKRKVLLLAALCTALTISRQSEAQTVGFQAESGVKGSDWNTETDGEVTYVTSATDLANSSAPGNDTKVISYSVTFPEAGTYDLYMRMRIGGTTQGGAQDDSFYYSNGFGVKSSSAGTDWITCNGMNGKGYTASGDVIADAGTASTLVWKWVNVSKYTGNETPISFTVSADALTQTFQIGGREDGFQIDKIVFGKTSAEFTVGELDAVVLPVTLVSFSGKSEPEGNILKWTTASEINSSHFEILRTIDGVDYESIGRKESLGAMGKGNAYVFTDRNVSAKAVVYYKLLQVDLNGKTTSYGPVVIKGKMQQDQLNVFASGSAVRINYHSNADGKITFMVNDLTGKQLIKSEKVVKVGNNDLTTVQANLVPGMYVVNILTAEGFSIAKKFIKQ